MQITKDHVENRLRELEHLRENAKVGKTISLKLTRMPKLNRVLGGLQRGELIAITGDTSSGKTKVAKWIMSNLFFNPNPQKYRIVWFGLEESLAEFLDSMFVTFYQIHYNEDVDIKQLRSTTDIPLPDNFFFNAKMIVKEIAEAMSHIDYIDHEYNPTGLYKACKEVAARYGIHHMKQRKDKKTGKMVEDYDYYEITDPDTQVVVVVDHINMLKAESTSGNVTKDQHGAMEKWVVNYAKKMITKRWQWTVINIIQQTVSNDLGGAYNYKGQLNVTKLEPSLDKLGNNKEIAREHYSVLGVFNPSYFDVVLYPHNPVKSGNSYDLVDWGQYYRSIILLKNRNGLPKIRLHYYFYGNSFQMEDAPDFNDEQGLNKLLEKHRKRKLLI